MAVRVDTSRVDLAVVGAGLMGAATAWAASRRGLSVVVFEQFAPGHDRGSSHGSARIVRRAYADPLYTRLMGAAFDLWDEVGDAADAPLLRMLGGLDFGGSRGVQAVTDNLTLNAVEHEVLDAGAAEQRWPGMRFAGPVVFHRQAGTVDAARAITTFLDVARTRGADVRFDTPVLRIEPGADSATVHVTDGKPITARAVVVAAGGWVGGLLGGLVALPPLEVREQQVFHFPRLDTAAPPWPSVIHEPGDAAPVYHLAGGRDGGPGDDRKIAHHGPGRLVDPGRVEREPDPAAQARIVEYVKRWLPGLDPTPSSVTTCPYTNTPSEDFLLDRAGPLVICSPCSGHGAKFAPLVGEWCAGLVTGAAEVPERFRLAAHAVAPRGHASF